MERSLLMVEHRDGDYPLATTPSWVRRRLIALSAALLLPAPSRDAFLFSANPAFYRLCAGSASDVRDAAKRILLHIDIPQYEVDVVFISRVTFAGRVQSGPNGFTILLNDAFRGDAKAVGAIIAHECCHILLQHRRLATFGNVQDEVHVDLAVMLTGLGMLTLNGIRDVARHEGFRVTHEHRSFGYLTATLLFRAHVDVVTMLDLDIESATIDAEQHLQSSLRFAMLWRRFVQRTINRSASAPIVRASRAPTHVVRMCENASCGQKLRLPLGRVGSVTCPTCGHVRQFDGRALRVQLEHESVAVYPEPVPPRWLSALASLPFAAKVLFSLMVAFPLFLLVREWVAASGQLPR